MQSVIFVSDLCRLDRDALEAHFLALGPEDRRRRFGMTVVDSALRAHVTDMDFEHGAVFGVFGDELQLCGAAQLARTDLAAEFGISVLPQERGRGLGAALLQRAHTHARNWGVRTLFMHCLAENGPMLRLARKHGMHVVAAAGDVDAWLRLSAADATSRSAAAHDQRIALCDHAFKVHRLGESRLAVAA